MTDKSKKDMLENGNLSFIDFLNQSTPIELNEFLKSRGKRKVRSMFIRL